MSSPLLVNCKELMLFMTLNMSEQAYSSSSTAPILDWLHLSAFQTNHSPDTPECWYYPEFRSSEPQDAISQGHVVALPPVVLSITYPEHDGSSNQDGQGTSNVILPSSVTEEPVPLASFFEVVPGAAMGLAEGLPLAQPTNLGQHTVGEPLLQDPAPIHVPEDGMDEAALLALAQTFEDLLQQYIASNDLDKMAVKVLEDLASHEMTPVDSLTSSRDPSILSDSPASPDIAPMLLKHTRFETNPENPFKISGDDVEDL
ncbi:hypothetical protein FRC07_007641 [Ceratobasidium sp. 392]|nr:hypothetical protein FRC07_007641 [Ceratobasidium sp. 392]